jgi:hypothetical protein
MAISPPNGNGAYLQSAGASVNVSPPSTTDSRATDGELEKHVSVGKV